MVANITTGKNIYGALAYNQQKVDKGQASILSTSQIREPEDGHYDVMQAAEELLAWMPSYVRTEKPVDYTKGDLKKQIAAVVKPVLAMYRFQTMGELRALLSLYKIGVDEVQGERGGIPYRGLVYTALDEKGDKAPVPPLKASRLGDDASLKKVERILNRSAEKIKAANLHKQTLHRVQEALIEAPTETVLRERLNAYHIDLFLRRNAQSRITGVTFIDHENRCVLNGSRLGKDYSANALNERFNSSIKSKQKQPVPEIHSTRKKTLR